MKRTLFHQSSMTEGPVLQGMLAFFLPIMLGTLLQQLYSAVDAVVLGQFVGKTALAAVGGSDIVLINLIVNFFVGLSSGASVVISQHAGAQEHEQASRAGHTAIFWPSWWARSQRCLAQPSRPCFFPRSIRRKIRCNTRRTTSSGTLRA